MSWKGILIERVSFDDGQQHRAKRNPSNNPGLLPALREVDTGLGETTVLQWNLPNTCLEGRAAKGMSSSIDGWMAGHHVERIFQEQELILRQEIGIWPIADTQRLRAAVTGSTLPLVEGYQQALALLKDGYNIDFVVDTLLLGRSEAERRLLQRIQRFLREMDTT